MNKVSFSEIIEKTGIKSSTLTHHLRELMKASLITNFYKKSEDGSRAYSYYELTDFGRDFYDALKKFHG